MNKATTRLGLLAIALAAAACGTPAPTPTGTTPLQTANPTRSSPSSTATPSIAADTVWLCRPGLARNPCAGNLDTTVMEADGSTHVEKAQSATDPPIDCFYVYPTVSKQPGANADLTIDPEERAAATAQAARFSQVCRVFAPMYPQLTTAATNKPNGITLASALTAYLGVDAAFRDYLANYNNGRGIVFIGHSQGAYMLTTLLKFEVDPNPAARSLLVSALLMGGNVTVPVGGTVGGDFQNIPACGSSSQTGCVVAYSSFDRTPPTNAYFGRVGTGLNPFASIGPSASGALQILCVNPAAPGGGTGALAPYFPAEGLATPVGTSAPSAAGSAPFIALPGEYSAHCMSSGGATWLQVDRTKSRTDHRPAYTSTEPRWGLHAIDVNVALGNLVDLVRSESASYVH